MDISPKMLEVAAHKAGELNFLPVKGNILDLPFLDNYFDKVISNTAIEFIADGEKALRELYRVLKPGGTLVIATLNRLSPWAEERTDRAKRGETDLYDKAYFRSPQELLALLSVPGEFKTVVHFFKDENPEKATVLEKEGIEANLDTGAFLVAKWVKTGITRLNYIHLRSSKKTKRGQNFKKKFCPLFAAQLLWCTNNQG